MNYLCSESAAITLCRYFITEKANLSIYDPKVPEEQIWMDLTEPGYDMNETEVRKRVTITHNHIDAIRSADAIVICTEWDEFKTYDYEKIYSLMNKPAFIFDGRLILDGPKLKKIGFHVEVIGKKVL